MSPAPLEETIPLPHTGQPDHLSLFLLPKHLSLIKFVKPSVRTVKVWPEGSGSLLQHQFQHTDWRLFATQATFDSHTDIETYASSVLDYINNVTTHKLIKTLTNQKPWMNREVRLQLKASEAAFRSGDAEAYSSSRANLKKGIKKAKHDHKLRIEEHFNNNSDPLCMWQVIQAITDYRPKNLTPTASNISITDKLNRFYARFDRDNKDPAIKAELPQTSCPTFIADVLSALSRVVVPTYFTTATIVPVPKQSAAASLNDFRPVALTPTIRLVLAYLKSCLPPTLDPHRSTEDAIATALHFVLTHLDKTNNYVRMLYIDFSSAFNMVVPSRLVTNLHDLGISPSLCNWT
uniref:uncharacterized protein LOC123994967 n=1 Tax=Oncorhynchus gorbuscha TaxID=8017 RepID=UPI001EAF45D8|nr:uncharacterized protein LOC123994967 [Oncorhynchus gorbuscha]